MNPAIEQLQARAIGAYTQLQPRERVIVVVGAAVLAVLIAYLGIWEPLVKAHHRNAEALEASRALARSEEHTSEPVTNAHLVCRLLLEKKKHTTTIRIKK